MFIVVHDFASLFKTTVPIMRIVTALYAINGGSLEFENYFPLLQQLRERTSLPITVFCERELPISGIDQRIVPLLDFEPYRTIVEAQPKLPSGIVNKSKATLEFFALMSTKLAFLARAAELYPEEQQLLWLDAGIVKIVSPSFDMECAVNAFRALKPKAAVAPGCWQRMAQVHLQSVFETPRWRFCGGLLYTHNSVVRSLADRYAQIVRRCLELGRITWEVNLFEVLESEGAPLLWYHGDHDESMLCVALKE